MTQEWLVRSLLLANKNIGGANLLLARGEVGMEQKYRLSAFHCSTRGANGRNSVSKAGPISLGYGDCSLHSPLRHRKYKNRQFQVLAAVIVKSSILRGVPPCSQKMQSPFLVAFFANCSVKGLGTAVLVMYIDTLKEAHE
jgi:hypothetical protein